MPLRRLLILSELSEARRVWDDVIPLLSEREVSVLMGSVFGYGTLHAQMQRLGTPCFSLHCGSSRSYLRSAMSLRRIAMRERVDVMHAIEAIPGFIAGLSPGSSRRYLAGFSRQHITMESRKMNLLSRLAVRRCDVTIACSRSSAEAAAQLDGVAPDKLRVVWNGANDMRLVACDEIATIRRDLHIPDHASVISVVARLRPVKGLDTLIASLTDVQRALTEPLHVVIAGDGESRSELEESADKTGIAVHFVGSQDDVAPWYAVGDVFAMPSRREALGVAALEAMAARRPVVASETGGLTEVVVDGDTGLLTPVGDVDALASALIRILSGKSAARAMGARGRDRFEQCFTNEAMVNGWLDVYNGLLA